MTNIITRSIQRVINNVVLNALKSTTQYPEWALEAANEEKFRMPDLSLFYNQTDLYRRLSWVGVAVELPSQMAATSRIDVKKKEGQKEVDIPNHPFELLLDRPNPNDSKFEFLLATFMFRKLAGNSYWWLNRSNENVPPEELWLIFPHQLKPIPDENMYLRGYMYDPGNGHQIPLEPWEIVHFKSFHPHSRFIGLSAIESLATVAIGDIKMQQWNLKLFAENNARLPGILAFADMIGDTDWKRLKDETRDKANKRELMMLRGVGDRGVNWMQAGTTQREMEFLKGRDFTKEEIFDRLAPGLASMLDVNATEANSKTGKSTFIDMTVWPLLEETAQKMTQKIIGSYGDNLIVRPEDIRITNVDEEVKKQEAFSLTHTIDQVNEEYYGDQPMGDERGKKLLIELRGSTGFGSKQGDIGQSAAALLPGDQASKNEYVIELNRLRRKALKKVGQKIEFDSDIIPADTLEELLSRLPSCKTDADIKRLFSLYEKKMPGGTNDQLLKAVNLAVQALVDG